MLLAFLLLPLVMVAQQKKISLDDIYRLGTFVPDAVPGFHSMNDGRYYTELSFKGLLKNDFITGLTTDTLIAISDAKDDLLAFTGFPKPTGARSGQPTPSSGSTRRSSAAPVS